MAVVFAALLATPALALRRQVVEFFSADPSPERIRLDFNSLRQRRAEGRSKYGGPAFTPTGPAREVMRVTIEGEVRALSVVPTREGAFCYRLHFTASCLTPDVTNGPVRIGVGGLSSQGGQGLDWLAGPVTGDGVEEVELLHQDGERVKLPFVWVSAPINAGFFAYDVPEEHERSGRLGVALVGLDENGNKVAHQCLPLPPEELARSVPEAASLCERRR